MIRKLSRSSFAGKIVLKKVEERVKSAKSEQKNKSGFKNREIKGDMA